MSTEESEDKYENLTITLAITAKIKMGKAVRRVNFETDFVLPDDLEDIALDRAAEYVEEECPGWKLDEIEWEVVDEEDEEEEEDSEEAQEQAPAE